jgi:hypothetical protein
MPFDVLGFYESIAAATLAGQITPCADTYYKISDGDYYIVQKYAPWLLGSFYEAISTPGKSQIFQPKLTPPYEFYRNMLDTLNDPVPGLENRMARPLPLYEGDKIAFRCINASTEANLAAIFLGSGKITQAMLDAVNPTHELCGTSAQTLTVGAWTDCTITWATTLPKGKYAIVGMEVGLYKSSGPANGVARILLMDTTWRPGCLASISGGATTLKKYQAMSPQPFEHWPLMKDIDFDVPDRMPSTMQVLSTVADTNETIHLSLQKIV